jgi:diguanylate cyclase (GGDEF)-like protein
MDPGHGDDAWTAARVEAYELMEIAQARPGTGQVRRALLGAEQQGWPDVALLLHYALFAQATLAGEDPRPALGWMQALARQVGDPALDALVLASSAELGWRGDAELSASADRDLARAVALLEEGGGSRLDRPTVWIQCSQAYHQLDLWELEEEMLARAAAETEQPWSERVESVRLDAARTVAFNRVEAAVPQVCALAELGEWEQAAALAGQALRLARANRDQLPPDWLGEVEAMRYLLAAVAGLPEPLSFQAVLDGVAGQQWPGYASCARLGRALRALDRGDREQAADEAEAALLGLRHDLQPPVRLLALSIAAARPPYPEAAARYAHRLAELRWQSRLQVLGAARSRLDAERIRLENERLSQRAYVDELTGLANRHAYTRFLHRVRQQTEAGWVAVVMIDVDRFKSVNDSFGHAVGDEVLRRLAGLLSLHVRPTDLVARLGGDEFIIVLDPNAAEGAESGGRRLVAEVAAGNWSELADRLTVTISAGLAAGPAAEVDELIRTADRRLYRAKRAGRNRLVAAGN